MTPVRVLVCLAIAVAASVSAVGGPADPPGVAVRGRCRDGREWTFLPADTERMLAALNQARSHAARPPVLRHPALDRMAQIHSVDMACRDYFDHRTRDRKGLKDKLKRAATGSVPDWDRLAEVIGTSETAPRQVERWLDSRSHRRAVLDEVHESVGIGLVRISAGSRYTTYWTVELMRER